MCGDAVGASHPRRRPHWAGYWEDNQEKKGQDTSALSAAAREFKRAFPALFGMGIKMSTKKTTKKNEALKKIEKYKTPLFDHGFVKVKDANMFQPSFFKYLLSALKKTNMAETCWHF